VEPRCAQNQGRGVKDEEPFSQSAVEASSRDRGALRGLDTTAERIVATVEGTEGSNDFTSYRLAREH
jgi:hypothetical protein